MSSTTTNPTSIINYETKTDHSKVEDTNLALARTPSTESTSAEQDRLSAERKIGSGAMEKEIDEGDVIAEGEET